MHGWAANSVGDVASDLWINSEDVMEFVRARGESPYNSDYMLSSRMAGEIERLVASIPVNLHPVAGERRGRDRVAVCAALGIRTPPPVPPSPPAPGPRMPPRPVRPRPTPQ